MHIYARPGDVHFRHVSSLHGATVLTESLHHDGTGTLPGIKHEGHWDLRPHKARVIHVDKGQILLWQALLDRRDDPLNETPLIHTVTTAELDAIAN